LTLLSDPKVTALSRPREISPTVDPRSGAVRVKLSIIDPPAAMTLGSVVAAEGRSKAVDKIILPWSALTSDARGPAVWVVDPQTNAVSLKSIVVDTYETNSVVVTSGLAPGDRVVTEGGKLLRPAQVVTYEGAKA
jgi:multidrug efflux pump subunit AcrA (membrane-fusion protein)